MKTKIPLSLLLFHCLQLCTAMEPSSSFGLWQLEPSESEDPLSSSCLYRRLGVAPSSSTEDIRKAYKGRARQTHPDKYGNEEERQVATQQFQKVLEAYEVLSDPERREEWDYENLPWYDFSDWKNSLHPYWVLLTYLCIPIKKE